MCMYVIMNTNVNHVNEMQKKVLTYNFFSQKQMLQSRLQYLGIVLFLEGALRTKLCFHPVLRFS